MIVTPFQDCKFRGKLISQPFSYCELRNSPRNGRIGLCLFSTEFILGPPSGCLATLNFPEQLNLPVCNTIPTGSFPFAFSLRKPACSHIW